MKKIRLDTRHSGILEVERKKIGRLLFPEWAMEVCDLQRSQSVPCLENGGFQEIRKRIQGTHGELLLATFITNFSKTWGDLARNLKQKTLD